MPARVSRSLRYREDMSRILVAYATSSGCTRSIAETVAQTLRDGGAEVDLLDVKQPDLDVDHDGDYDAIILGSGVRDIEWHPAAVEWLKGNAAEARLVPFAAFTVCLSIRNPEKTESVLGYTAPLFAETGVKPVSVGLFAGWNKPETFPGAEREFMEKLGDEGDWRDMEAVARWTREIAPQLVAA